MTTFDRWELIARTALSDHGIGYHEATPLIEDARSHHEQSGVDPWQALGPPERFAADVAAARPAAGARVDTQGKTSRDYLSDGMFAVAFVGVLASLSAIWANRGLTVPLTAAGSLGTVLASSSLLAFLAAPGALRASGRPRLAPWGFVAGAVLAVAAAVAFTALPRERIGETPALGLLVVCLGLCWVLTRPTRGRGPAGAADPADPEDWFARLRGVLAGRFDVPPDRAGALVEQARAHVAAAGTTPREEFPSLAEYARDLAEQEPGRQPAWWRRPTVVRTARIVTIALLILAAAQALVDGDWWVTVTGASVALLQALELRR
ncbi:hypothetical protein [Actinoplanes teichomyceticus]|uniref:Uncharacterized protein n=1 Tax=Actinoplanes teichomyceticus TaxID=1867 RepID=A0A561VMT5_ACTTI|nr:hypothetical protein [Actinoplanes teichomyceticus]TWG12936.1 hypothetical protein FHX34_105804 [Actinoplanes teichomyceticus]GIF13690.1 hypothetical protein Ate01nite_37220 [Actinoplanes teichomyceticus]